MGVAALHITCFANDPNSTDLIRLVMRNLAQTAPTFISMKQIRSVLVSPQQQDVASMRIRNDLASSCAESLPNATFCWSTANLRSETMVSCFSPEMAPFTTWGGTRFCCDAGQELVHR